MSQYKHTCTYTVQNDLVEQEHASRDFPLSESIDKKCNSKMFL